MFGFVPALQSSRVDLVSVINEDASPRGAARGRMRAGLVVAQVAVSLLLLVGAGLATRSVDAARRANPGFDAEPRDGDRAGRQTERLRRGARPRLLSQTAGRRAADAGDRVGDASRRTSRWDCSIRACSASRSRATSRDRVKIWRSCRTPSAPDYFRTLRIPLLAGREFEDRDDETAAPVAIVNATLAQRFWGGASNAIGKRIRVGDGEWRTVIGVAADVKYSRINEAPRPYFYLPFLQAYRSSMVLHTRGASALAIEQLVVGRARARRALDARSADSVGAADGRGRSRGALHFLQPDRDDAASSSARPAWRSRRWAPTGWCRTPSSRARTRSASAWRSARRACRSSAIPRAAACGSGRSARRSASSRRSASAGC